MWPRERGGDPARGGPSPCFWSAKLSGDLGMEHEKCLEDFLEVAPPHMGLPPAWTSLLGFLLRHRAKQKGVPAFA